MLEFENKYKNDGYKYIIGIDEAGRGPLAGPVVAAAVALRNFDFLCKIGDSKSLSSSQRENAFYEILENAYIGVSIINERIIDSHNILESTYISMNNAVNQLISRIPSGTEEYVCENNTILLIDGNRFKTDLPYNFQTIIKGDSLSISIACASIIAKVIRDRILCVYDKIFPEYGFVKHKGYPTRQHRKAIQEHGLSMIHRKSFNVKSLV